MNIIDHFSKFGISFLLENKEAKIILHYLELALEYYGMPEEIGKDNGKEFKNINIENYLAKKEIKIIHGISYNPHSQGVVERFHQTIKDMLYSKYAELEIVVKKYNNHVNSATKTPPSIIFYSNSKELFEKVLENTNNSFRRFKKETKIYIDNKK